MPASNYQIRVCENPACGLRYPLVEGHPFGERCPLCLGATHAVLARPLTPEPFSPLNEPPPARRSFAVLLDNVRSAWNVGAILRTADCLGIAPLYLCGITPTPENDSVKKTALGAENAVPWEYARNAVELAKALVKNGTRLWALEQDDRAVPLSETDWAAEPGAEKRMVLVVGNEVTGVDPALLDLCERIVYIPMQGGKRSLNVETAFGVAAWELGKKPRL